MCSSAKGITACERLEVIMDEKLDLAADIANCKGSEVEIIPGQFELFNKSCGRRRKSWCWWALALLIIFSNMTARIVRGSHTQDLNTTYEQLLTFREPLFDVQTRVLEEYIAVMGLKLMPGNETWVMEEMRYMVLEAESEHYEGAAWGSGLLRYREGRELEQDQYL